MIGFSYDGNSLIIAFAFLIFLPCFIEIES